MHYISKIWQSARVLTHVKGRTINQFQIYLIFFFYSLTEMLRKQNLLYLTYQVRKYLFFCFGQCLDTSPPRLRAKEWQVREKHLRFHSKSDNWHSINLRFALKNTTYQQAVVNTARGYNSSKREWPLYGPEPEIHFCHKRHPCCSGFTLTPLGR